MQSISFSLNAKFYKKLYNTSVEIFFYIHISFFVYINLIMFCIEYLPLFFLQKIRSLMILLRIGKVYCRLSIVSMILECILINECNEGTSKIIIIKKEKSARILLTNFSLELSSELGHSPSKFRLARFSFTAHSKSSYRNFNETNFYLGTFNFILKPFISKYIITYITQIL